MSSANDATVAVAEHLAGSNEEMVVLMNERARALVLTGTSYTSPHGLPPELFYLAMIESGFGRKPGT